MEQLKSFIHSNKYLLAFLGMGLIYTLNLFLDIMDVDAAQYASISREMLERGSFLEVYHRGLDYLDKPPLLFWLSALSFKLFGINNVAFKLPAVLVVLLGIYSTYRLAKMWHGEKTARVAALLLGYCQAVFLMTNDIRMDGMLMSWTIFSIWQLSSFLKNKKTGNFLLGFIGIGMAMLTKGPLGLIIPAAAFSTDFLLKRQWKNFLRWEWLLGLLIILVCLSPMLWGLYHQFDLHPEKEVYGLKGPSGIRFFFWTQSFGRITGDIYWDNGAPWYFFLGTILWDFAPWIFLLFPAIFWQIRELIRERFKGKNDQEYLSLGGFVLVFVMLSMSNYKLPHYIFPLLPFAAIMSSRFLFSLKEKNLRPLAGIQMGFLHLFFISIALFFLFCFYPNPFWGSLLWFGGLALVWVAFLRGENFRQRFIFSTLIASICLNLVISLHFYPSILPYQASIRVGKKVKQAEKDWDDFFSLYHISHSLDFYSRRTNFYRFPKYLAEREGGTWVYTGDKGRAELDSLAPGKFRVIARYQYHKISNLSLEFLLRSSRDSTVQPLYLLEKIE